MAEMEGMIPTTWTTLWSDSNNTGTWRTSIPVYQNRPSPCHMACPVSGVIPTWIEQLRKGEFHQAWSALMENNPFPSVTGRVCHHPCESFCNRSRYDEKISIKMLERYLGDLALDKGWYFSSKGVTQKEVIAVVGGGPAGLSAAYHLSLKGYRVEIFETREKLGGLMRYGIPSYRLPRKVLDQEIDRLLQVEIGVHTGVAISGAEDYHRLQREYNAVFVATGAQRSKEFSELDDRSGILLDGLNFLSQVNMGMTPTLGQNVIIVGGGNTAIDAARVAKRIGAGEVTVVYRRTEEQMPCQEIEIIEAREEGIKFSYLAYPVKIDRESGADKLVCQKMRLGEKDSSGRPSPEAVEGAYFSLKADHVIIAIGTEPVIPEIGDKVEAESLLHVNTNQETSIKGLFAGGDLTSRERFVSSALGAGKKAAEGIDLFLEGSDGDPAFEGKEVSYEEVNTFYFPKGTGIKNTSLPASERIKNFEEVQLGISDEMAFKEAQRCFICGRCVTCDNCFYYCPDMAISRNDAEDTGYMVLDQYCKGCGLCVKECPRGAIVLREEIR